MWNIALREIKDRKWSLLAYCLGSLLMLWLYVATFESSQNSTAQLQELVKTYPKGLLDAIGLSDLNINTIEVYLNAKHFALIWPLLAIFLALSRAGNQVASEIQSGTIGLLLSLPLKRYKIFFSKYLAGLAMILLFTAVSVFGAIPLAYGYGIPTHMNILFSAWILTSLFIWTIYSIGMAVSSSVNDKSSVYAVVGGFLFLSYMIYIVALISESFVCLKSLSLFHYFNTQEVLASGNIPAKSWLVFTVIIIATSMFAAIRFNKRDMSV